MLIPSTLRNGTIADHCGFMFMENHTAFEKLRFKNVFRHVNEKPTFSNSSGLKNVFEKPRFLDGLVWMVGNRRNKAAFSNFPGVVCDCISDVIFIIL